MKRLRWAGILLISMVSAEVTSADDAVDATGSEADRAAPTVIDVTPVGIDLVIGVNRCEEAYDRMYALNAALSSGYMPDSFREQSDRLFGQGVVDYTGPMAIFGMSPFDTRNFPVERLGAVVAVQDPPTARTRMGAPDGLLDEQHFVGRFNEPRFSLPMAFRGHRLYISYPSVDSPHGVMDDILAQEELAGELDPDTRQRLDAADFVAIARRGPMLEDFWQETLPVMAEDAAMEDEQRQIAQQLQQLVQSVALATFTGNVVSDEDASESLLGASAGISMLCDHADDSESAMLLANLAGQGRPATLESLPTGDVVVAYATNLAGPYQHAFARHLVEVVSDRWHSSHGLPDSLLAEQFLAIFEQAGNHTQGARVGVYRNDNLESHGQFGIVMILDTEDPDLFLTEIRQFIRLATADEIASAGDVAPVTDDEIRQLVEQLGDRLYRVRRDAANQLILIGPRVIPFVREGLTADSLELRTRAQTILTRLEELSSIESRHFFGSDLFKDLDLDLQYTIDGKTLDNERTVDVISARIGDEENQRFALQLATWLGPDWHRMHLAATDKHIVILVGSRIELLTMTIGNLEGVKSESIQLNHYGNVDRPSQFEIHVDLNAFLPDNSAAAASTDDASGAEEPTTAVELASFALSITPQAVYIDAFAPLSQLRRNRWLFFW